MIAALVLIPLVGGLLAFATRNSAQRAILLVSVAVLHIALTAWSWVAPAAPALGGWMGIDALGSLFLSITSVLFLATAIYSVGYLRTHEGHYKSFVGCMLFFLAAMTMVTVSQHLGLLWVAVEATTLASAPLIWFHRHARSIDAMWKYLLICSVGIALALLGNFCFAAASSGHDASMVLGDFVQAAPLLQASWIKVGFLCLLVGYGTKMGLAPLHNWLPDAHSESPSPVSALLSGALLNCAFLGILRALAVCNAAGLGEFGRDLLLGFGLFSMVVAAVFILQQTDFKRLLAYSSVEHMGILAIGVGLGGRGSFGAMYHAVNHSLTKAMLFLVAGNILNAYRTKSTTDVRGVLRALPVTGVLWIAGLFAVTGSPPFGTFLSEFTILRAALEQHRAVVGVAYLVLLAVIFVGMSRTFLFMAQGDPVGSSSDGTPGDVKFERESRLSLVTPVALCLGVLVLGVYLPPALRDLFQAAADSLGVAR